MEQFYQDNYFTEFHYFSQRLIPFRSHQKTKEESTKEAKTPISDDRKDSTVSSNVSKKYDFISQIQAFQYQKNELLSLTFLQFFFMLIEIKIPIHQNFVRRIHLSKIKTKTNMVLRVKKRCRKTKYF